MKKGKVLIGRVHYDEGNNLGFSNPIINGFRCSIWADENDFTAVEWAEVEPLPILPGQSSVVKMNVLVTKLWDKLEEGKIMYWGVPHTAIGSFEIIELDKLQ
jgi:hypothetical protein